MSKSVPHPLHNPTKLRCARKQNISLAFFLYPSAYLCIHMKYIEIYRFTDNAIKMKSLAGWRWPLSEYFPTVSDWESIWRVIYYDIAMQRFVLGGSHTQIGRPQLQTCIRQWNQILSQLSANVFYPWICLGGKHNAILEARENSFRHHEKSFSLTGHSGRQCYETTSLNSSLPWKRTSHQDWVCWEPLKCARDCTLPLVLDVNLLNVKLAFCPEHGLVIDVRVLDRVLMQE